MNTSARSRLQSMKAPMKLEKKAEMQGGKPNVAKNRRISSRERKIALQQDVDNLKKQLRHEENIHKALERAFRRPLGALPRLPPYLPRATLELVAEVAVLEEEVVQLEEQIVYFRQDMYQEAVYISSSKRNMGSFSDLYTFNPDKNSKPDQLKSLAQNLDKSATSMIRHLPSLSTDGTGKENAFSTANAIMNIKGSSIHKAQTSKHMFKRPAVNNGSAEKKLDSPKLQLERRLTDQENVEARTVVTPGERLSGDDGPNKVIFLRMSSMKNKGAADNLPFSSTLVSQENREEIEFRDPYGICSEFGNRDIGSYRRLFSIEPGAINPRTITFVHNPACVNQNLTIIFHSIGFNSCPKPIISAFLEHGIPESAEMVVELMRKATITIGGHLLNAILIEHLILRLPYYSKYLSACHLLPSFDQTISKGAKTDEMAVRNKFGLELSEPLVSFVLCCGNWSSPALRLRMNWEWQKKYLQPAIGITTKKFEMKVRVYTFLALSASRFSEVLDY
ncbi:transcription factor [Salix suchowensis]|nr:transcription factor [Salix suchowensis]